jgi:hypothetical protein
MYGRAKIRLIQMLQNVLFTRALSESCVSLSSAKIIFGCVIRSHKRFSESNSLQLLILEIFYVDLRRQPVL